MSEDWNWQLKNRVNTLESLAGYIDVTPEEAKAIASLRTTWGTTPYFASLMDRSDPACPIRRQVVPSMQEAENVYGIPNYLVFKENRATGEMRPDCIGRQYRDRVVFAVTRVCATYCRFCFRREMVIDGDLELRIDVDEGLRWIAEHAGIRDVLITGGDPFHLSDDRLEYLVRKLREIPHVEMIRFGTRTLAALPMRVTEGLRKVLEGFHRVPIWVNTQFNHPREITARAARAVYDLLTCGVAVGNQAVLLKGINDTVPVFRELHQKLLQIRVRPYYLFYCEPVPGADHFRTTVEKGSQLIREALRGHTTGMAQPMYVVATDVGKIPLMQDDRIVEQTDSEFVFVNHEGRTTRFPRIKE